MVPEGSTLESSRLRASKRMSRHWRSRFFLKKLRDHEIDIRKISHPRWSAQYPTWPNFKKNRPSGEPGRDLGDKFLPVGQGCFGTFQLAKEDRAAQKLEPLQQHGARNYSGAVMRRLRRICTEY